MSCLVLNTFQESHDLHKKIRVPQPKHELHTMGWDQFLIFLHIVTDILTCHKDIKYCFFMSLPLG